MKTQISEVQITIKDPDCSHGNFNAVVRDGELDCLDAMRGEKSSPMPTVEKLKAYIQFLQEVIEAMEES